MPSEFQNDALVLVGHGSTLNGESAAPTHRHADELRARGVFAQVVECFWKEQPTIAGVLRGVFTPRVFVVPLFISDGYFTEQIIPRELGFPGPPPPPGGTRPPLARGGQVVHYCGPVGTHGGMTNVILARAAGVVRSDPARPAPAPAETSLFIAGHGTGNNENSRRAIEQQVDLIRARGLYHDVHPIFMEEDPRIAECHRLAGTANIVVVPFFIADGLHSYEDIPVMLGASLDDVQARYRSGRPTWDNPTELHGRRVWYSRSIGDEPRLADVIVERVREAAQAAGTPVPA